MKTFRHILTYLQAALLIGLATACRDDLNTPSVAPDVDIDTGISIRIPNLSRAADFARSRADDPIPNANIIADEGAIYDDDLWLFIYNADGNKGYEYNKAIQIPALKSLPSLKKDVNGNTLLDANGNPIKDWAGAYKVENSTAIDDEVRVPLYPGNYKVYVVANLHEYLGENLYKGSGDELEPIDEATLNQKVLDFAKTDSSGNPLTGSQVLKPGHLPMVCFPEDVETDVTGAISAGVFNILSNDVKTLKCNLNFLCAKVRYTVLFDNTDGGFSNEQFGSYMLDFGTANTITNVRSNTAVTGTPSTVSFFEDATKNRLSFSLPLDRKVYPTESGRDYPKKDSEKVSDLPAHTSAWGASDKQRAWQGTIYIPENPEKSNDANRTKLHLDGTVGEGGSPYDITLIKSADGQTEAKEIERGKFYDLTILATKLNKTEIKFTITDWTQQQLIYDLHGPYFLHIKQNPVNVVPGEKYNMWYETNAEYLEGYSPMVTLDSGKKVPLYKFDEDKDNNMFIVWINPEVKSKYFDSIKANKEKYNFFHIKAGNLYKRVEVYPFDLDLFLIVDPDDVTINVREKIASGDYGDKYIVTIQTNYDSYTITQDKWEELFSDGTSTNTSNDLYLTKSDGTRVIFGTPITPSETGVDKYELHYAGLNDGRTFWTEDSHKLALIVTATTEDNSKTSDPERVNIQTYPSSDDYIIHVKLPASWDSPHIYVYQCLEFPATTNDGNRANKPLATNSTGGTAALEYSFTGKIAFKGWYVGAYNDPNVAADKTSNGFWYFKDDTSWDPADANDKHYYELDFAQAIRQEVGKSTECEACGHTYSRTGRNDGKGYNRLWPGIRMKWEKNTGNDNEPKWWKFKLTGIATPGKALIMWSNSHCGDNAKRYPNYPSGSSIPDPGIPLFDYPNREGWIDLTTDEGKRNGFTPIDPTNNNNNNDDDSGDVTYRVYWPSTDTSNRHNIHYWTTEIDEKKAGLGPIAIEGETSSGWETNYYYDITVSATTTELKVQIYRASDDKEYVGEYNIIGHSNTRKASSGQSYQYLHKFSY